ncbi:hypothetical protein CVT26_007190 [Gymnopilus dilepis]|uniref:F-box domain-containing protein n=1 Tax=Gymnopilus dilepis TaxID=231916 RepID=A0A409W085_9AGAR|nr:hypothetical protein CVT26_007190 [Gymnopilus dilepis]
MDMNPFLQHDLALALMRTCLQEQPVIIPPSPADPRHGLCLVSSLWRDVIVFNSEFWQSYSFWPVHFSNPHQQLAIFRSFILRSGGRPLEFKFLLSIPGLEAIFSRLPINLRIFGAGKISIVNTIIAPYSNRIKSLHCTLIGLENAHFFLDLPVGSFSQLEYVNVTFIDPRRPNSPPRFTLNQRLRFTPFQSTPNLREVICGMFSDVNILDLKLPLRELTLLNMETTPLPLNAFVPIARLCQQSLIEGHFYLKFDVGSKHFGSNLIGHPIILGCIEVLSFRLVNANWYPEFITTLRLEKLKSLQIMRCERTAPFNWDIPLYTSFISGSSGSLLSLRLQVFPYKGQEVVHLHTSACHQRPSQEELFGFFASMPKVKSLSLPTDIHLHGGILEKVATGELLPQLTDVEFASNRGLALIFDAFRDRSDFHYWHSPSTSASSPLSRISSVTLSIPSTSADAEDSLEAKAESLRLVKGFRLRYIRTCDSCARHCRLFV